MLWGLNFALEELSGGLRQSRTTHLAVLFQVMKWCVLFIF